jgi:hypothetical protein
MLKAGGHREQECCPLCAESYWWHRSPNHMPTKWGRSHIPTFSNYSLFQDWAASRISFFSWRNKEDRVLILPYLASSIKKQRFASSFSLPNTGRITRNSPPSTRQIQKKLIPGFNPESLRNHPYCWDSVSTICHSGQSAIRNTHYTFATTLRPS